MKKIYSWNVNGIRAGLRKGTFEDFLKTHDPDILCLQETKAEKNQVEIDFPQYTEIWNSAEKKGYSGTAIFAKEKPLSVLHDFHPNIGADELILDDQGRKASHEGRVISAEFDDYYVITVYTPNAKADLTRLAFRHKIWDPLFLAHCKELEKHKPVIFCGDLNVAHTEIDLANPKQNIGEHGFTNEEREGIDKILEAGFLDTFREIHGKKEQAYTWWSNWGKARERNVGWRIDYFFISTALKATLADAKIHADVLGSDHCPVSITLTQ